MKSAKVLFLVKAMFVLLAVIGLSLASVTPGYAGSYAGVKGKITFVNGKNTVATYSGSSPCTLVSPYHCHVDVMISNKTDYSKFQTWCKTNTVTVTIPSGQGQVTNLSCYGSGGSTILTNAATIDSTGSMTLVSSYVIVDIQAQPPK